MLVASYDSEVAKVFGLAAASFLWKIDFLSQFTEDGWAWHSGEQFWNELGLSRHVLERVVDTLKVKGIISVKIGAISDRHHVRLFKINYEKLKESVPGFGFSRKKEKTDEETATTTTAAKLFSSIYDTVEYAETGKLKQLNMSKRGNSNSGEKIQYAETGKLKNLNMPKRGNSNNGLNMSKRGSSICPNGEIEYVQTGKASIEYDNEYDIEYDIHVPTSVSICPNGEIKPQNSRRFVKPTLAEVKAYCEEIQASVDPDQFINYYTSNGWMVGKTHMKDWKAAIRTWNSKDKKAADKNKSKNKFITRQDDLSF